MKASELIKLEKVKINKRLSEETLCFSADILVKKTAVGIVNNCGTGGCHDYFFYNEVGKKLFNNALQKWKEANNYTGIEANDAMVNDWLEEAEDKRIAKRLKKKGFPVSLKVWTGKQSVGTVEWYEKVYMLGLKDESEARRCAQAEKADKWELVKV